MELPKFESPATTTSASGVWTQDLLIVSPMLYILRDHAPITGFNHLRYKFLRKLIMLSTLMLN